MIDDLDRIMRVMDAAFDPAFGEAWSRRQVADALVIPGTNYLLAGADGNPPPPGEPAAAFALSRTVLDEEELLLLAVDPRHRHKGLGSRLLRQLKQAARERGVTRLFLEMRDGNAAEALYRRHGFSAIARRKHYYRRGTSGPVDAITFSCPLEN
jgi:ribosomal-protein-alanine N-acetyltransferase